MGSGRYPGDGLVVMTVNDCFLAVGSDFDVVFMYVDI